MLRKTSSKGFGIVETLIVVLVVAALAFGGWYVWQKNKKDEPVKSGNTNSQTNNKPNEKPKQTDPSEGGKYLVIKEWGVRVAVPTDLQGKVTYVLGDKVTDPDNNQIQAAKIFLKNDPAAGNECAVTTMAAGDFIDSAAQLLRVEEAKPFDTTRYKATFKANLLTDGGYVYHLNYLTPDCAGPSAVQQIEELQGALVHLEGVDNQ